ncbi:hypothetical protein [Dyella acidisoli]|uniref:Uncharacterized protein n=1 Tax=Dyella acidisoli TaxID=1867834 RepID=A0ABQ5XL62_9GAMM|nr:hypothetical protein [Dyella acidisoli]GLQ91144.1 hypothetical protein GCM10007901_00940 [Dyella acidisoli]
MKSNGQRLLMIYAGVLTVVLAAAAVSGFVQASRSMTLKQFDVQRINMHEPNAITPLLISIRVEVAI